MSRLVRICFVGDVMLARAIDMVQSKSCDPTLYEGNGLNAYDYVKLAVSRSGPLPEHRDASYVWGDTLGSSAGLDHPDLHIINLETSVSTSMKPWPRKAVHYKMHPANVDIIKVYTALLSK